MHAKPGNEAAADMTYALPIELRRTHNLAANVRRRDSNPQP